MIFTTTSLKNEIYIFSHLPEKNNYDMSFAMN